MDAENRKEKENRADERNKQIYNDSTKREDGPFRKLWDDFSGTTGFHGLNKMSFRLDKTSIIRSLVWFVLWLVCTVYVIFLVIKELQYYYSYPAETNTQLNIEKRLPFPAITVCNLNFLNRSSFLSDFRVELAYLIPESMNWTDPIYEQEGFFNNRSFEDLIAESKSLESFAFSPSFNNEPIDLFFVITDIGICLRVNGQGTWKTSRYGSFNNLKLHLNLNNEVDYVSTALSSGVKVAIHDPMEEPIMSNEGIVVRPRSEAFIEIQRQEKVFLPAPFKAIGNRYCNNAPEYSHNKCLIDCYIEEVQKLCGCIPLITSNTEGPFCSRFKQLTCADFALGEVRANDTCICTYKCEFATYTKTLSTGEFPSKLQYQLMREQLRELDPLIDLYDPSVKENILENNLVVRVFYTDLTVIKTEHVPKFPNTGALLANLGGQLGLFLGASILTLMEIAEVLVFLCLHMCNKIKRKRQNKIDKN